MSAKLTKALLSLALLGILLPSAGCDIRKRGSSSGSYSVTDVLLDFAWVPSFSSYDTVEYYEETVYDSGYSSGGCYDCGYSTGTTYYYEDDYYGDYYYEEEYYEDDYWWKTKRSDKRR